MATADTTAGTKAHTHAGRRIHARLKTPHNCGPATPVVHLSWTLEQASRVRAVQIDRTMWRALWGYPYPWEAEAIRTARRPASPGEGRHLMCALFSIITDNLITSIVCHFRHTIQKRESCTFFCQKISDLLVFSHVNTTNIENNKKSYLYP